MQGENQLGQFCSSRVNHSGLASGRGKILEMEKSMGQDIIMISEDTKSHAKSQDLLFLFLMIMCKFIYLYKQS